MKRFLALTLITSVTLTAKPEPTPPPASPLAQNLVKPLTTVQPYEAKDYSYLIGMPGFGDETLKMHFKLYKGYVNNTNLLLSILRQYAADGKDRTPQYAEIKRRVGWEFDGMRLHEDYFDNLGGKDSVLPPDSLLGKRIALDFGSYEKWKQDFMATGVMRGVFLIEGG